MHWNCPACTCGHIPPGICGHALVELAHTSHFYRSHCYQLLPGYRNTGAFKDPLWGLSRTRQMRWPSWPLARALESKMGRHERGRTHKVPQPLRGLVRTGVQIGGGFIISELRSPIPIAIGIKSQAANSKRELLGC